jgi:hypothetical protein
MNMTTVPSDKLKEMQYEIERLRVDLAEREAQIAVLRETLNGIRDCSVFDVNKYIEKSLATPPQAIYLKRWLGEPVAWIDHHKAGDNLNWEQGDLRDTPLYAAPKGLK